jgi:NADPH2:quinone reductase
LLGKRVLVTGAAGGVGRFAIQLAKGAGAHVTAVIGSPERSQGLTDLGADEIVVDFASEGLPFDLLLESVGGRSLAAALARVAPAGTIVSFGNSSGEPTEFDVSSFYRHGAGARLYAFLVFDDLRHAGSGTHDLELLAGLVAEGALDPQISLETHWHEPEEAFRALIERRVLGKAVLRVD